jgi:hypothetical protein
MLKGVKAIMTGLFGVDCEHDGCKSELHPVYAMAANVHDDPTDDLWAMFVRNWGDEGYCSRHDWPAEFTTYTFRIPWRQGMQSVEVLWGIGRSQFEGTGGTSGPTIVWTPGQGIDVTFTLPPPSEKPLIDGELHLRWRGEVVARPRAESNAYSVEKDDEAGPIRAATDRLPSAKRGQVAKVRPPASTERPALYPLPWSHGAARQVAALPASPPAATRLGTKGAVAARKLARDAAKRSALCRVSGGSLPGLPDDFCTQVDR